MCDTHTALAARSLATQKDGMPDVTVEVNVSDADFLSLVGATPCLFHSDALTGLHVSKVALDHK